MTTFIIIMLSLLSHFHSFKMMLSTNTAHSSLATNQSLQPSSNCNKSFDGNESKVPYVLQTKRLCARSKVKDEKTIYNKSTNSKTVATTSAISLPTSKRKAYGSFTNEYLKLEQEKFLHLFVETELTHRDINIIRDSLMTQKKLTPTKESYLQWINYHLPSASRSLSTMGSHLDYIVGKEYIYVKDAIKAIEQLITRRIISNEEVENSQHIHTLTKAEPYDFLTVHSLSSIIRRIFANRLVSNNNLNVSHF